MAARPFLAVILGVVALAALVGASTTATAGRACISGARAGGYSYAGHQASHRGHGVRATITATRSPSVDAGHVAGWVGVGGPGQGVNGEDAWVQAGIGSMPGKGAFLYAEVTREGRQPEFILIAEGVAVGESHRIAVLETSGRPGWWQVSVDGKTVVDSVRLRGSSGRWAPIATAESWNAGRPSCNAFGFSFERVAVSSGGSSSWRPFVPGYRFLDGANSLRKAAGPPYAFVATSS
jgi:hypothetical protein